MFSLELSRPLGSHRAMCSIYCRYGYRLFRLIFSMSWQFRENFLKVSGVIVIDGSIGSEKFSHCWASGSQALHMSEF